MVSKNNFINIKKKSDVWDAENIYHLKTDTTRISKLIYHCEIYKKILKLPGDVVECGVFKGISLTRFLTFRKILESENSRKIYGLDVFGKFPKPKNISDKKFLKKWENEAGDGISKKKLDEIFKEKKFDNFKLIVGNIKKTIPYFLKQNPQIKISLLHLDMDIYEPTKFALDKLFSRVVRRGIILIDDYNSVFGATKAVDEFLQKKPLLTIQKLNFYRVPSFIIKN